MRLFVTLPTTATSMPFVAYSSAPSTRMRFTSPETVMRLAFVTAPETTHQPEVSVVSPK